MVMWCKQSESQPRDVFNYVHGLSWHLLSCILVKLRNYLADYIPHHEEDHLVVFVFGTHGLGMLSFLQLVL